MHHISRNLVTSTCFSLQLYSNLKPYSKPPGCSIRLLSHHFSSACDRVHCFTSLHHASHMASPRSTHRSTPQLRAPTEALPAQRWMLAVAPKVLGEPVCQLRTCFTLHSIQLSGEI